MTDATIEETLVSKFLELDGLTITENGECLEVALPNKNFKRPEDGYWYELNFLPGIPSQIELGTSGRSRWIGVLQILVCTPKDSGTKPANERFNSIADLFRSGLYINGVRITRCYRTSALEDGDYYVVPVTVEYWADLDR